MKTTRDILEHTKRRRGAPVLWGSGALAATILVLGVNGTLSTWTTAIIDNNNNSVASTDAVALVETQVTPAGNATVCDTATSATNTLQGSASCSDINKFGGIGTAGHDPGDTAANDDTNALGTALDPDDPTGANTQAVKVNLENDGTATGTLTLDAGTCEHYAYPSSTGADTMTYDLCTQMKLAVSCSDPAGGSTAVFAPASGTIAAFEGTGKAITTLAATKSTDCTFTVTLPATTPSGYASQYLTQDLTWTLTKS